MSLPLPLVSCIMPTKNRREFVPKAVEYFLRQTYPNKLLMVGDDDGDMPTDLDLFAGRPVCGVTIRQGLTLGAKRNAMISLCSNRGLIAHWDDDDWYGPERLADQVARFTSGVEVCGIEHPLFYDLRTWRTYRYQYRGPGGYLYSATLMYTREFWQSAPFPDIQVGAGNPFILAHHRLDHAAFIQRSNWYVGITHAENNSPKDFTRQEYVQQEFGLQTDPRTRERLGADWPFYQGLRERMGVAA